MLSFSIRTLYNGSANTYDLERWVEMFDFGYSEVVKVLDVTDEWIRIEYTRTKENHLLKKETVIKLIDINLVNGFEIMEDEA